jgi:hypothetical protein
MIDEAAMGELSTICPGAQEITEGGIAYLCTACYAMA